MKAKIINDPVYGFLRFTEHELLHIIAHPWFQRLQRIRQMGMANLVYPGAVHTRFHHSLGACHLMGEALDVLKSKGIAFDDEECTAARLAILLHDVGHGPFSHALENLLANGISHEMLSAMIMERLNQEMDGALTTAIKIFDHSYPKRYLHQLVSGQLDMDRMDYLNRDSFYTGVSEGVIGYDRILQMLTVSGNQLVVESKAVHSVEKFIIARRLMYWQVYLHKTVLGAEQLLINILKRAKELAAAGAQLFATPALHHFLYGNISAQDFKASPHHLDIFCRLDDSDIVASLKVWSGHEDKVLATLCGMMIDRRLYKIILSANSLEHLLPEKTEIAAKKLGLRNEHELSYFAFTGQTTNNTYNTADERILILQKSGTVIDISEVEDPLVTQTLARPVVKNYICYLNP